jgi:hypothetical protein
MPDYTAGKARILLEPSARGFFVKAKAALRDDFGGKKLEQDVQLRPQTNRFRADADAQLRSMRGIDYKVTLRPNIPNRALFRSDAKAQAETHLKGLHATMQVRGMVDMTYANNQLRAWRVKEEAKPLKIRVITEHVGGVGRGAGSMIRRDAIPQLQPTQTFAFGHMVPILKPKVDEAETRQAADKIKKKLEEPGNQPRIRPRVEQSEMDRIMAQLRRSFQPRRLPGPSIRGVELLAPAMLSLASEAAPALVVAMGEVVGAINEMAGAALAAPGALAVLGTSITTLALGVSGIKGAWKALQQQQDQAANSATSQAMKYDQQNEQLRHGLYDVQKAQEGLTNARKDARRELEDLHAEERSSYLSVAEAALDLQKARNELSKPSEGPLDYNEKILAELKARENLSQAIRRQGRTRQDTQEADKKGIENSDKVREAQEALVRSNEQVALTLKEIQEGGAGAAGAADKVKNAMSQLSPEAAQLTQTLFDLKNGPLNDLAKVSSANMFRGMSDGIKALVNADMPLLTSGFARVSSAINRNFNTALGSLNTDQNRGVLSRIFGNTEEFHKRINAAIDPAIRALGTLTAAGSNAMPALATQFAHLTDRFAKFIDTADKDGRLDQWINRGISGVESLARSAGNLVRMVYNIGQAFGGGMLPWLERTTKKWEEFFRTGSGQTDLLKMIQLVHREMDDWRPLLQDLPTIFGAAMTGLRGTMGTILPVLNVITSTLRAFPGLASSIASGFVAWRAFTPIFTLVSAGLTGVVTGLNKIPGVANAAKNTVGARMQEIARLTTGVGRGATAAEREGSSAFSRLGSTIKGVGTTAVGGLSSALGKVAGVLGAGGPWGAAIAVGITMLTQWAQKSHDAADAADAQRIATDKLAGSLEQVTNAAGAATRTQLGLELESYKPAQGLQGNVRLAAEGRGINRDRLMQAILPGGGDTAKGIYGDIRKDLRQPILDAAGPVAKILQGQGFSEDNLVDAYLGDPDQLARLRDIMDRPQMKLPPQAGGLMGFNLSKITGKLSQQQQQGALVTQYLQSRIPALQSAQTQAREAQRTAVGGTPTLTDTAKGIFGPGATPSFDGTTAKIEIPGDFVATHRKEADRLKQSGNTFSPYDTFRGVTTMTVGTDDLQTLMNIPAPPAPPGRQDGGPSPTVGAPGPTGGIISELHPGEWVLPRHARQRLGDEWLQQQTRNKAVNPASIMRGSYEIGGPAPLAPFLPPLAPQPPGPPGPPLDPNAPGEASPPPIVPVPPLGIQGTGPRPGPAVVPPGATGPPQPGAAPPQIGTSHAGGAGAPFDPNGPVNVGRIPDGASPEEQAALGAPGPTVDPATGQLTSPQAKLPDFGTSLKDAFLAPWGMRTDPNTGQVVSSQPREVTQKAQEAYLGKWAGGFGVSLGETLINGVASFFGLNLDNPYFQAFKQTVGFYSGKIGSQTDQYVDPTTQSIVGQQVSGYQTLVDPATGTTYLIPSDPSAATAGAPDQPLGDLTRLPVGKAPEAGLQPNAIKAERAISAAFPEIKVIGGVRSDKLKWHPMGLALDVMMPGMEGMDNNAETTPAALAEGNKIWAWMQAHAKELGIDMGASLWQVPDHHNHIHVAVYGNGNPAPEGAGGGGGGEPPAAPAEAPAPGLPPLTDLVPPHPGGAPPPGATNKPRWMNGVPQGWHDYGAPASAPGRLWIYPDGTPAFKDHNDWRHPPEGYTWHSENSPPGIAGWLAKNDFIGTPTWPEGAPVAAPGAPPPVQGPVVAPPPPGRPPLGSGPHGPGPEPRQATPRIGGSAFVTSSGRRVVILPASARSSLLGGNRGGGGDGAIGGEPGHDRESVGRYIFSAAKARGYNDHDALAIAAYAYGESHFDPGISGGAQAAGGGTGGDADVVIGLFQEKPDFARAGGVSPSQRFTVAGNVTAYLNQLTQHREGDIYDQLLATSKGGPMYTGGRGAMGGLGEQVRMLLGMPTAQGQHMHYAYGGLLPQGVTIAHHEDPKPDIVIPYADAQRVVQHLNAIPAPPDVPDAQKMAPQPPPEVNIPKALPPPGPQAAAPPPTTPTATLPPAPAPAAAPAGPTPSAEGQSYEHPGLKQAVTSGAAAAGNLAAAAAAAAASSFGGGAGGPLIAGLFQQGGKIANDAINVGAAFASGFLKFGGTTENPYGVMERRQDKPPPLAQDNRRVHQGDNYFASMDEWRRQNQLQDAQDMQAGMARIK